MIFIIFIAINQNTGWNGQSNIFNIIILFKQEFWNLRQFVYILYFVCDTLQTYYSTSPSDRIKRIISKANDYFLIFWGYDSEVLIKFIASILNI